MSEKSSEALTLFDLMNNPSGKHTRQVGARYMIRDAITEKFRTSMRDPLTRKRYKVAVSKGKAERSFLLWVKVPSEKYQLDYDVVISLVFPEGTRATNNAEIQLFSNSPGWAMVNGYAAATQGLLIPGWEKPLGRAATEAPDITNPNQEYGYDKTTYRAFLFITLYANLVTYNDLQTSIGGRMPSPKDRAMTVEAKLLEYEIAKRKYDDEQRRAKEEAKRAEERDKKKSSPANKTTGPQRPSVKNRTAATSRSVKSVKSAGSRRK